jgi:hypothetical protein
VTLDQALLTGLVVATIVGLVITWLVHRTQAKWRQRDLLRDFFGAWAGQVVIPTERDALYIKDKGLRLPVEREAHFPLAFKLAPRGLQHQYEEFIKARSAYITECHRLYDQIKHKCEDRTGLPVVSWGNSRDWPREVLLPNFVITIYEQALGTKQNTFRLEDISYNIGSFSQTGQGFERKGLHLKTTYDAYNGLELAEAGDEAKAVLERIQATHRQMMETDYRGKFAAEVERIGYLLKDASAIASKVSEALRRLQVS